MAKLSHEQITDEVKKFGYTLIDDSGYINMQSRIKVQCEKGHIIETCLADLRRPSFTCPACDQNIQFVNPAAIPQKNGAHRVIAFDQATEKFGLSIFDNGKLVYYNLYVFTGDLNNRLVKIDNFLRETVLKYWEPDFIVMEDIQYQNGVLTFKVLAMLLGITQTACAAAKVPFEVVSPNVWRKYAGTNGKNRQEEKMLSVAAVHQKYGVKVSDDVAEAILIGRYGASHHGPEIKMAFGKKK